MKLIIFCFSVLIFYGCSTTSVKEMMKIETSTAQERQLQTKKFDTIDKDKILFSSIATLQDLGFNIDEINRDFGIISASKTRDAREIGDQVGVVLLALFFGVDSSRQTDYIQEIKASVVVSSNLKTNTTFLRFTMQRVIKNEEGRVNDVETIKDKEIYQQFYEKLSKSVFLEANEL